MTTTYDPMHPAYTDEADARLEIARVQNVCHECRRCVSLCSSFPTLFELLDQQADPSADLLTPAQQDLVVDACVHCSMCTTDCPYTHGRSEAEVDVPRLMLRARAMQLEHGYHGPMTQLGVRIMQRPDRVGRLATRFPSLANRLVGATPGSRTRRILSKAVGVSAHRALAPFAAQRFSAWFAERPTITLRKRQAAVTVFPTCLVEYQATSVGKDLVKVYERNGIECSTSAAGCCGAPLLHSGNVAAFSKLATENVTRLAAQIRAGNDIVVPEPGCRRVLTDDSVDYITDPGVLADAALVASSTYDASGYLMKLHREDNYVLDTHFDGQMHRRIAYRASSHSRARRDGLPGRDLLKLTGARLDLAHGPADGEGIWAMRATESDTTDTACPDAAAAAGRPSVVGDAVAGDSHLSNTAWAAAESVSPRHPVELIARAYGIPEER